MDRNPLSTRRSSGPGHLCGYRPQLVLLEERLVLGDSVLVPLAGAAALGSIAFSSNDSIPIELVQFRSATAQEGGIDDFIASLEARKTTRRAMDLTRPPSLQNSTLPAHPTLEDCEKETPFRQTFSRSFLFVANHHPATFDLPTGNLGLVGRQGTTPGISQNLGNRADQLQQLAGLLLGSQSGPVGESISADQKANIEEQLSELDMSFEPHVGQTDSQVDFLARGAGYSLFLTSTEAVMVLANAEGGMRNAELEEPNAAFNLPGRGEGPFSPSPLAGEGRGEGSDSPFPIPHSPLSSVVRMQIIGANPSAEGRGTHTLPGKVNYFLGNDPSQWHSNIPTFARVEYDDVYPGIDLVWYGHNQELEYDFVVSPGADPSQIRLNISGAERMELDAAGDLLLHVDESVTLRQQAPFVYQDVNGQRQEVASRFELSTTHQISFALNAYNPTLPLVIDPVLTYSTYLGGSGIDAGRAVAVDRAGNAWVIGETSSADFPTAIYPWLTWQGKYGGSSYDAFVAKLSADGSALLFSTYLGGSDYDVGRGVALDEAGNAWVSGSTDSTNFPLRNPLQEIPGGTYDAFVAKLAANGSVLLFSTYLGGANQDGSYALAVDGVGQAWVSGFTRSTNFPTINPFQRNNRGNDDVFVAKLTADGSAFLFSTYLGGTSLETGQALAVDEAGNGWVTGETLSDDFPTRNAFQRNKRGSEDVFVTKLTANGAAILFSTYLGGTSIDYGFAVAVDDAGNGWVSGATLSTNFPIRNPLQANNRGIYDVFVTKLAANGSAILFSTYLGGSSEDYGYVVLDSSGNGWVSGLTYSSNFPTAKPLQGSYRGNGDVFVARLAADGSALPFSTYWGGSGIDGGLNLAVDGTGNVVVTGATYSLDFPTTPGAFDRTCGTNEFCNDSPDVFLMRLGFAYKPDGFQRRGLTLA